MDIWYIGGSPCSGKSTIAGTIAREYSLCYFKVDDFLDKYIARGAGKGHEVCARQSKMSFAQILMQRPERLCKEELRIYREIFGFIKEDLRAIRIQDGEKGIIAEGAAFLPGLMGQENVPQNRYVSITPTKDFQVEHYKKREWVPHFLEECPDKERAFQNWMDRDALFAEDVRRQCRENDYVSLVADGAAGIDTMTGIVRAHFGFA